MNKLTFLKNCNITEQQFIGQTPINGDLDLCSITSIPEGFNPTVGGGLYLSSLTSIPEGFNPTVGGSLNLNSLTSIPEGFNPTVGGYLYLSSLTSIPEGFNPTVGGSLYLRSLKSIPEGFNPTVGGSLYLRSLTSIPEGFNPTVGGSLNLYNLKSIPEGFNPTVGEYLFLPSLKSIPEGFNPTVGGNLYLGSLTSTYTILVGPVTWGDKYIKADGMFTEIVHRRGNIFKVKKLNDDKIFYLVTDGNNKWSHGVTLKQAKDDLIYKIKSSDTSEYKNFTKDTSVSFEKGIEMYRTITGACSFGVKDFVKTKNIKNKKYKISEIIKITENSYGHKEFKEFFIK